MISRHHSKQVFIPKFNLEKHKPYAAAFRTRTLKSFYNHLIRFLRDENMSPSNKEDVAIFHHFMFNSNWGVVCVPFMKHLLNKINNYNFNWTIDVIGKYFNFVSNIASIYYLDILNTLFRDYGNQKMFEGIFKTISPSNKIVFLEKIALYPAVQEHFPKLGLYLLFS